MALNETVGLSSSEKSSFMLCDLSSTITKAKPGNVAFVDIRFGQS